MTFEEWFEQEFVPSFAYSGEDPHRYESIARSAWEAGFQSGQDHQLELERLAAYDRSVFGDH